MDANHCGEDFDNLVETPSPPERAGVRPTLYAGTEISVEIKVFRHPESNHKTRLLLLNYGHLRHWSHHYLPESTIFEIF